MSFEFFDHTGDNRHGPRVGDLHPSGEGKTAVAGIEGGVVAQFDDVPVAVEFEGMIDAIDIGQVAHDPIRVIDEIARFDITAGIAHSVGIAVPVEEGRREP